MLAGNLDIHGIRSVWEEVFTDDKEYLDIMFSKIMPHCRSYIHKENNEVLSVASFMPMQFHSPLIAAPLNGWYMFGVATKEKARGSKLAAKLIAEITENLKSEGYDFIFERPAIQSLNNYYLKLGFSVPVKKQPIDFSQTAISAQQILKQIRDHYPTRFEWQKPELLNSLLELGELEYHKTAAEQAAAEESSYIAINVLGKHEKNLFSNCFFCFPME